MKLSELKTRLKNKYVVRIVAGVLTIALLGSSMTAVAVQADQKKDAAVQTEQKEDSSDKKDDIEDLLQVSVSDKKMFTLFPMQREVCIIPLSPIT